MTSPITVTTQEVQSFHQAIRDAETIAISGHTNPDGDCVGSCLALYAYIKNRYPDKKAEILLEPVGERFRFLKYADRVTQTPGEEPYDLFFCLDCSDSGRLARFGETFEKAKHTVCVDHHISNQDTFGEYRFVNAEAAATCQMLYLLFEEPHIDFECAQALYLGISHDTGIFKHSNTTRQVMEIAGALIEKGVRPEFIIDETFYKKTYIQNQILGRALMESILLLDGSIIFSVIKKKDMEIYGVDGSDMDGIIDQLRVTEGVECALFLYEKEEGLFKVSMRSNGRVNVSEIAQTFGGGGHIKAAGCTVAGDVRDTINNIAYMVEYQLKQDSEND